MANRAPEIGRGTTEAYHHSQGLDFKKFSHGGTLRSQYWGF